MKTVAEMMTDDALARQTSGAEIPMQTSLAAWKSIAEERLAAVEMWKDKCAAHEVEIKRLRALIQNTRSRAVNLATLLESAMRDAINIETAANERPRDT